MRTDLTGARGAPLDLSYALIALEDATDHDEIFEVLLRAVRSRTRFAALLSVHAEHLRGRTALGEGANPARIHELRISRNQIGAFEAAIESRTPSVGSLATGEPFIDGLLEELGGPTPAALVLPVLIGTRTVALVVAHRGPDEVLATADVADLFPLIAASGPALGRALAARSKAAAPRRAETLGYASIEVIEPKTLAGLRAAGAWDELAERIRERIRAGMEHGDPDEDEQLELLLELGHVEAEQLGRPDRAVEAWRSAQAIDASEPRVLDALQALAVQQGDWEVSADLLERRVALADGAAGRVPLLLELAEIAHDRLEDDERAIAAYERVLHLDPVHEVATGRLDDMYSSRKQWQPLAALQLDRASRQPDPARALEGVARMYEDQVGDVRAAFLVWLAVVRSAPDRAHAIDELARLGPLAHAWDEIVVECAAIAEELGAAGGPLWRLVGTWLRDHTADRDDAIQAFDRAWSLEPADPTAFDELAAMLRADGRWGELASLLHRGVDGETEPGRRSELHAELGAIHERELGDADRAITCFEQSRVDEPESRAALDGLHRLYRRSGAWPALAELLPHLVAIHDPVDERARMVELDVELGDVLVDHLGNHGGAIRAYEAALALEPNHAQAFAGLSRVYRTTGQTEALLDATELAIDAAGRDDQLRKYGEVAAGWHQRARFDRAIACWQKLLVLDPTSLPAHEGLASALRGAARWPSLVAALRARLDVVAAPGERVTTLVELAEILATQLDDTDGAIAAYEAVLALDRDHRGALDALGRLHDRAGRLKPALAALTRLLELTTTEPRRRADVFQRIGILYFNARDLVNARLHVVQALALDLDNAGAHEAMGRLHLLQDEIVAAGEELVRAAQLAPDDADKLRCFADAAWVFRHRLHDAERARQCLHLILDIDPDNADAKQALAELLHDTRQWETLWPHLEQEALRAKTDSAMSSHDKCEAFVRAARCALEIDHLATALELFELACAIDGDPALQIERAEALYRSKGLDAAAAAYQQIVLRHAQALDRPQLVGVYRRLAEIHTALGKPAQAQLFHQKLLDIEPRHRATLKDLADLHQTRGRFDEAIASLRTLVEVTPAPERVAVLERIGDIYRDKLRNSPRALSSYLEALELDASSHRVRQRVLDLQTEAGQWKSAAETIDRFLEHEADPVRRGAYHLASAEIRRTELRDKAGALDAYDHALDELLREDPLAPQTRTRALAVFATIDEIVTADKNWKYQEQSYRRMIKRLPKGDPILVQLWHALGEVYRTRLKHFKSAIEAFEIAHTLDPEKSPARATILAELFALLDADASGVSQRAAKLVAVDPTHPDAYRALGRRSLEAGRIDEAWCVARALCVVKKATAEEQALYKRYQAHEATKATGVLDDDAWSYLRDPDEDLAISAIFALTWEGLVALRAGPAKAFELKAKERMPIEDGSRVIAKIFRHAARVLNVSLPDVYVQSWRPGRLLLANCIERGRLAPAVIVGRDLMIGYRDTELAAAVGAMLAVLRPTYYLKLALNVDELEAALGAIAQIVGRSGVGRPQLEPLRAGFVADLEKRLTRQTAVTLQGLVQRLPAQPDLARWRTAVDIAAQRAGLIVSGELAAAVRMLSSETSAGGRRPNQRVQDLISYSVSPEYFAARAHLGVAIR